MEDVKGLRDVKTPVAFMALILFTSFLVAITTAQEPPTGVVIPNQAGLTDPAVTYALYLPKSYSSDRPHPILLAFHPSARGVAFVEKYRAAAEQYGYIIAASNVSRNGDWNRSVTAAQAMINDVGARFAIDPKRAYTTGFSGGARLALHIAMSTGKIAGVIASGAGLPDAGVRTSLKFPVYLTAGLSDFNYIELRKLDRTLKSPHRLALFEGGHTLPPDDVALRGIEWLELQAMAAGTRPRDQALIDHLWARREQAIAEAGETPEGLRQLQSAALDFGSLRDVREVQERAAALARRPDVKAAIDAERKSDRTEEELVASIVKYEVELRDPAKREASLTALRQIVGDLRRSSNLPEATIERDRARRVLRIIVADADRRVEDPDYLRLLQEARRR